MALRMKVHDREPIGLALRRFKKLLERSGITHEMRIRRHFVPRTQLRRQKEYRKWQKARWETRLGRPQ